MPLHIYIRRDTRWVTYIPTGLKFRVRSRKLIFLVLNQNICYGCTKEPSQWDGSFEHPKHTFKLIGKKIFTILRSKLLFIKTYIQINKKVDCKIIYIFLTISLNSCFGCSKETSHWDGPFEYPQHMFGLGNKKIILIMFSYPKACTSALNFVIACHMGFDARKPVFGGLRTTQAQTAHQRSLISALVIRFFESIISNLATGEISIF